MIDHLAPNLIVSGELWNTPKIFVAFGMILAVVEDKSESIAGMQHKADRLDRRLELFSAITSPLLSGAELNTICPAIASAITEVSTFSVAVVQLEDGDGRLRVAGSSGLSAESLRNLRGQTQGWTLDHIKSLCANARRMGKNSYLMLPDEAILFGLRADSNAQWKNGEELLIPLCSDGGAYLGCIRLAATTRRAHDSRARTVAHRNARQRHCAAVELQSLHTQLVCSEKLAALGQLLAGVAHELNNPLTAIMGYGELINDAIAAPQARDQLANLVSEARRMNRIIDNLLRFSRHGARALAGCATLPGGTTGAGAARILHAPPATSESNSTSRRTLPFLAVSEDEIKQILLNLLNNSSDALDEIGGSKRISIRAYPAGPRA